MAALCRAPLRPTSTAMAMCSPFARRYRRCEPNRSLGAHCSRGTQKTRALRGHLPGVSDSVRVIAPLRRTSFVRIRLRWLR